MADNENRDWWKKYATKFCGGSGAPNAGSGTTDAPKSADTPGGGRVFRDEFDNEGKHMYHVEMVRETKGVFTTSLDIAADSQKEAVDAADYIQADMSDCEFENVEMLNSHTHAKSVTEISVENP